MKALANVNPRDFKDAVVKLRQANAMAVGGGSDLVGMVKEHLVEPDVLVHDLNSRSDTTAFQAVNFSWSCSILALRD